MVVLTTNIALEIWCAVPRDRAPTGSFNNTTITDAAVRAFRELLPGKCSVLFPTSYSVDGLNTKIAAQKTISFTSTYENVF